VKNLNELEVISASVKIEDGNRMEGQATVPLDPVMAVLDSLGVTCEYLPDSSQQGKDVFAVRATPYLAQSVGGPVSGVARIVGGSSQSAGLSFATGATRDTVSLGEVTATVGSIVEVEATLTSNGSGSVSGGAVAEKLEDQLTHLALDVVRKSDATASGFATFQVMGQIQAELPYKNGEAKWSVAGESGSATVPKDTGLVTFQTGPKMLKPGSMVDGTATLANGGALVASAMVPDEEINSLTGASLTATADDAENVNGPYTLHLSLSGIAPKGEGAVVSISGPVDVSSVTLDGHGGNVQVVVASGQTFPPGREVVIVVVIDGGNSLEARWAGPPPLPVEEEPAEDKEESTKPPPIPIPDPLPPGAVPPPLPPEPPSLDDEEKKEEVEELKADLVGPAERVVRQGVRWVRIQVSRSDGSPAVGAMVTVEIAENENWMDGLRGKILTMQPMFVGEDGFIEIEYETADFATLPEGNSMRERFLIYHEIETAPWTGNEFEMH